MSDTPPPEGCSIAATLAAVGDRWTLLILRDLFRGVRRFERLHRDLGIARNLLTDRLQKLVDMGIVHRVPYQDRPVRNEYRLTATGVDLSPALVALMGWGARWGAGGGTPLAPAVAGPHGHEPGGPTHIRSRPGPGSTVEALL